MRLFRPSCAALAATAAVTALTLTPAAAAPAALGTSWHVVFTKHYGAANNFSGYTAVAPVSRTSAWAFGSTRIDGFPAPGTPVAVQWNGTSWQSSSLPSGLASDIGAASVVSASDVWAITETGGDVLHWNGAQWSVAEQVPGSRDSLLTGIEAVSDSDIWVFGTSGGGPGLGTWHFDGTTWTHITTGQASRVSGVTALSATDMWGSGSTAAGPSGNELVHFNGVTWQSVTAPALNGLDFGSTLPLSGTEVWATAIPGGISTKPLLVLDNNGTWTQVKLPWSVGNLGTLASDGHGGFWLNADSNTVSKAWLVHRTAAGTWSRTSTPGFMSQLALIPGTSSLWGSGWADTAGGTGANAQIWAHGPAA
jgi:hypothetical protein